MATSSATDHHPPDPRNVSTTSSQERHQQLTRDSKTRRRCWATNSTFLPARRTRLVGMSLLLVYSILASRFSAIEAGLTELLMPYTQENRMTATTIDSNGNLLVSGCTIAGGSSAARAAMFALNSVAFVAKYAQTGEQLWRREINGREKADCSSVFIAADKDANVFVTGSTIITSASVDTNGENGSDASDIFVSKLASSGEVLWCKTHGTSQRDEATAIKVNPSGSAVYVTGFSGGDMTTIQQNATMVEQSVPESLSSSNCVRWGRTASNSYSSVSEPLPSAEQECLAGFVLKMETLAGDLQWVHQVTSTNSSGIDGGDHRVFGVDVDEYGHAVVVGDTKGDLRIQQQPHNEFIVANVSSVQPGNGSVVLNHAGDLFVRKLDELMGTTLWTTQIGTSGAIAELCRLPDTEGGSTIKKRGNCGIALAPSAGSSAEHGCIYITGTTFGLVSTVDQDLEQYAALCSSDAILRAKTKSKKMTRLFEGTVAPTVATFVADCAYQTLFAKLKVADGRVEWVRQVISASRNNAEGIALVPVLVDETNLNSNSSSTGGGENSDTVIFGLADPGLLSSSDSMEQLFVLRVSTGTAIPGETKWIKQTGLSGEDQALGIATTSQDQLLVMGFGNRESSNTGKNATWSAYVQKLDTLSGESRPFCVDAFAFQTNTTIVQQLKSERVVVFVTVERSNERCGGSSSVAYAAGLESAPVVPAELLARPGVDFIISKGLVRFAPGQKTATIAVDVLPAETQTAAAQEEVPVRSFVLVLEILAQETSVVLTAPSKMEIGIQMVATTTSVSQLFNSDDTGGNGGSNGDEAADGRFWRRLSRICALAIGLVLVLVVVFGRFCGGACSLRKAKAFQYKRIKSPRASATTTSHSPGGLLELEPSMRRTSSTSASTSTRRLGASANVIAVRLSRDRRLSASAGSQHEAFGLAGALHEEEEDEELRTHLDEIQQLNDSLEAFIHNNITTGSQRRKPSVGGNGENDQQSGAGNSTSPGVVMPILSAPAPITTTNSLMRSKPRKKVSPSFILSES